MRNTFGNNLSVTIFGESHGEAIGALIDGIAPGIEVDTDFIKSQLSLRRPSGDISTTRTEKDKFKILSGVFEGKTTGTPILILIENADTVSKDYGEMASVARPSHADFTAFKKYGGFADFRGGGHFSGRITAGVVAAAALVIPALKKRGISVGTHIKSIGDIKDRDFLDINQDIITLSTLPFAVLDGAKGEEMMQKIRSLKAEGDSVGGVLETAVTGVDAGLGEPFFDSVESLLSHGLFSIPGVKGVEFGAGFEISQMTGSVANDLFYAKDDKILTKTNNSGGINGGITNGMPIIFRCAMRPTPTISKEQTTVNFKTNEDTVLRAKGRHDPCIVHRARVVVDSITALVIADLLATHYGTDWLAE